MKRTVLVGALLVSAGALPTVAAQAQTAAAGSFTLTGHTHSSQFGGPHGSGTLFPTNPVPFPVQDGTFSYSSIPCDVPAPFNDVSLDFKPDYPGIEDPASTRHFVEYTLDVGESGDRGTVEGEILTILCLDRDESEHTITFDFSGTFQASGDTIRFRGTFVATGGTGTFADFSAEGKIRGVITCLRGTLEAEGAESCADLGVYSDSVFFLKGEFTDPTVTTA